MGVSIPEKKKHTKKDSVCSDDIDYVDRSAFLVD